MDAPALIPAPPAASRMPAYKSRVTAAEFGAGRAVAADDKSPHAGEVAAVLAAVDAAREAFDANDRAGHDAEGAVAAAELAWTDDMSDSNWNRVEAHQRDARKAALRAGALGAALERAEVAYLATLRDALTAERAALAEQFAAELAPALAAYVSMAYQLQGIGAGVDAVVRRYRERARALWSRSASAGLLRTRDGTPPELMIAVDGFTLANCALRRANTFYWRQLGNPPGALPEFTPLTMLTQCDGENAGAERRAVDAAVALAAPDIDPSPEACERRRASREELNTTLVRCGVSPMAHPVVALFDRPDDAGDAANACTTDNPDNTTNNHDTPEAP